MDECVNDTCNVVREQGYKNANGTPDRYQQVSVMAYENLKITTPIFHHRWRFTNNWDIWNVQEEELAGQKKHEDNYMDHNVLLKVNKADMVGMIATSKEYFRPHCMRRYYSMYFKEVGDSSLICDHSTCNS